MSVKNILLTGAFAYSDKDIKDIESLGYKADFIQFEQDTVECPEKYDAVICNGLFLYNDINLFKKLRYIQLTSAGYDRVPMDIIKEKNIEIHNARGVYSIPMAEWAVMNALELYKQSRFFFKNQTCKLWQKNRSIRELNGKNVTVIGCGSIGTETAKRFKAFGCYITGVDIFAPENEWYDEYIATDNIDSALVKGDVVILTVPLNASTYHLMNIDRLKAMKNDAVLINISRGSVVDQAALEHALINGIISGAALDVFEEEPLNESSSLWELNNVIITPHNSFVGDGNRKRMFEVIINNLKGVVS